MIKVCTLQVQLWFGFVKSLGPDNNDRLQHIALGVVGLGAEDACCHLLNLLGTQIPNAITSQSVTI